MSRLRQRDPEDLRRAALRLTVQFTSLVLVLLAIVGGVVFVIVSHSIDESDTRQLVAATQVDSGRDAPEGTLVTIVDGRTGGQIITPAGMPSGLLDTSALQAVAAGGDDERSQRTVDGQTYSLLTTSSTDDPRQDRVVQVALDLHEGAEERARLATALLVGGALAVVLAFAAAYLMARRAIRPLADALALQRRFVADASHELRTPLTLLSTRAQMLKRRSRSDLPEDVTASVDDIVGDAQALTEILDDLLIAADPRSDAKQDPVDLVAVADQAIGLLADDATARRITLTRTDGPASAIVTGSAAALLRLVIALSTNALDHARSSVTVSVAVTTSPSTVVLTVADDGPGFAPEIAATAFERFASGRSATGTGSGTGSGTTAGAGAAASTDAHSASTSASPTGTSATGTASASEGHIRHYGLGLAIVSEIARRHGGSVTIGPSRSGGAVVVRLPLSSTPSQ